MTDLRPGGAFRFENRAHGPAFTGTDLTLDNLVRYMTAHAKSAAS